MDLQKLKSWPWRSPWPWVAAGLLLLGACGARWQNIGHSLWYDEAWVANALLSPSWHDLFFYPAWLQTTPPGFLLFVHTILQLAGDSNTAFHLPAFGLGLLGVAAVLWLGWKEFSAARGLWIAFLAAYSTSIVSYAKELKQYSGEFLVAALLLLYLTGWRRLPLPLIQWATPLIFGIAFLFCPASVVFLPAAFLLLLLEGEKLGIPKPQLRIWAFYWAVGSLALILPSYYYFTAPNREASLLVFWGPCFIPKGHPEQAFRIFYNNLKTVLVQNFDTPLLGFRYSVTLGAQMFFLVFVPMAAFWTGLQRGGRALSLLVCSLVPLVTALVASLVGLYPLCEVRFVQFLTPSVLLLHALALDILPAGERFRKLGYLFLAGLLLYGTWVGWQQVSWPPRSQSAIEDAFLWLQQNRSSTEPLYVHGALQEQFELYSRKSPQQRENVLRSQTGLGCCPRGMDFYRSYGDPEVFRNEFALLLARGMGKSFWLIYARQGDAVRVPRPEEPIHRKILSDLNCIQQQAQSYSDLSILKYSCPAAALAQFSEHFENTPAWRGDSAQKP